MTRAVLAVLWALSAAARAAAGDPTPSAESVREAVETGDLEAGVALGEALVKNEPRSAEAHDLLGRAYGREAEHGNPFRQVSLARKARAEFARAVELDEANAAALADLATYDLRAPALLGGDRKRARREAEGVLRLDPVHGHELLGAVAEASGDMVSALESFRRALEAQPDSPRARRALSGFLTRRKRFAEARAIWSATEDPRSADPVDAYELAGIALESAEQVDAARAELRRAVEARATAATADDPRPAEMCFRLSLLDERLGHRDEARKHLDEALRLEPRHRDWRKQRDRLLR